MKKINIYKVKSFAYTPFENQRDIEYFNNNGIFITKNIKEADVLVSQNFKHLKGYFWKFFRSKKFLIWTFEPRFDTSFAPVKKIFFGAGSCHFMNVYTGDVFSSKLVFHLDQIKEKLKLVDHDFKFKSRKIVALMSYYNGVETPPLMREGENIDLINLRSTIALEGFKRSKVDIYGAGWPQGVIIEDSRGGQWKGPKLEILKSYNFNLCFENTIASNYITEKIWDSIAGYCLPIYYGKGNNIYELFPENSFVDYSRINDPLKLFNYISEMTEAEYTLRLNKCINVYNSISQKQSESFIWGNRKHSLDKIILKLKEITHA